jgi:hypothetical protein
MNAKTKKNKARSIDKPAKAICFSINPIAGICVVTAAMSSAMVIFLSI